MRYGALAKVPAGASIIDERVCRLPERGGEGGPVLFGPVSGAENGPPSHHDSLPRWRVTDNNTGIVARDSACGGKLVTDQRDLRRGCHAPARMERAALIGRDDRRVRNAPAHDDLLLRAGAPVSSRLRVRTSSRSLTARLELKPA